MTISIAKHVYESLNRQITEELYSSYLYLSMSAALQDMGLEGCAHWMRIQAQEEKDHAMKIYDHILLRGHKVKLFAIDAPKHEWHSVLNIFEDMLEHEEKVTALIVKINEEAIAEKDYQTQNFIRWFVDEQVEEESEASRLLDRLKKMHSSELGVLMFDKELGERK